MTQANPITFLQEARSELMKVRWPTRPEIIRLTSVVIALSVAIGLFIGTLDALLVKLTELSF